MKFLKSRAALSAVGSVFVEKAREVKSDYSEKKDTLAVQAAAEQAANEVKAAEDRKAELAQKVKDARRIAREAQKELKELASQPAPAVESTDESTPDNVVSL